MKECTETDKLEVGKLQTDRTLVSIVLATYNPRMDWLREQLASLENQTYRPLELLVMDDCSTKMTLREIQDCVEDCIQSIPYQIMQNEENLGSTKTFEKLTILARGEYIAYCDQDDIWHRDKIKTLLSYLSKESVNVTYSDVIVIDEDGVKKANSIMEYRKRHILQDGFDLSKILVVQNFVIGCTMLIRKEMAQQAVPFIPYMVHDHYLALVASINGEIALCKVPLVYYRIHTDNQSNTLSNVNNKENYYKFKIKNYNQRIEQLELKKISEKIPEFQDIKKWAVARDKFYNNSFRNAVTIWKLRKFDPGVSMFELLLIKMPDRVFSYMLKKIKKEEN